MQVSQLLRVTVWNIIKYNSGYSLYFDIVKLSEKWTNLFAGSKKKYISFLLVKGVDIFCERKRRKFNWSKPWMAAVIAQSDGSSTETSIFFCRF